MNSNDSHPAAGLDARLVVVAGRASKREVALKLPATLGRGEKATLLIHHPTVSRAHCTIVEEHGMLVLRDLKSLNGTFVGDKQVDEAVLMPGDTVTIGPLTFRVQYVPAPTASEAAAPAAPLASSRIVQPADDPLDLDVQEVAFAPLEANGEKVHVDDMIDFVLGIGVADEEDSGIHTKR